MTSNAIQNSGSTLSHAVRSPAIDTPTLVQTVTAGAKYQGRTIAVGNGDSSTRLFAGAQAEKQLGGWSDEKIAQMRDSITQQLARSPRSADFAASRGIKYGELTSSNRDKLDKLLLNGASDPGRKSKLDDQSAGSENNLPKLSSGVVREEILRSSARVPLLQVGGNSDHAPSAASAISNESEASIHEGVENRMNTELHAPQLSTGEAREQSLSLVAHIKNAFSSFFSLIGGGISSIASVFRSTQTILEQSLLAALTGPLKDSEKSSAATSGVLSLVSKQFATDVARGDYLINGNKYKANDFQGYNGKDLEEKMRDKQAEMAEDLFKACNGNEPQLRVVSLLASQRTAGCMLDALRINNYEAPGVYDKKLIEEAKSSGRNLVDIIGGRTTVSQFDIVSQSDGSVICEVVYQKLRPDGLSLPGAEVTMLDQDNSWLDMRCAIRIGAEPVPGVTLVPVSHSSGKALSVDVRITQE